MKTILVLTDFSPNANHAAYYTLKLAQSIKANLLVCNMFLVPYVEPMTKQIAWPEENFLTIEDDSINKLNKLTESLNNELDKNKANTLFRPAIGQLSSSGSITDVFNETIADQNIIMVAISTHDANSLSDHAQNIIEKANCPLLVVPAKSVFDGFNKISFASDLIHYNLDVLHCLYNLTHYFEPEILITHIADENAEDHENQKAIEHFYNKVSSGLNYPRMNYRVEKNKSVANGLNWVSEHAGIDLLVLVHHKRNFFQKIFFESVTQKMAHQFTRPMLIFPFAKK